MSVGAKCIIAKASCLPEIFGESAYWIDPYDTDVDLDELLSHDVASPEKVLNKYTFKRFAKLCIMPYVDFLNIFFTVLLLFFLEDTFSNS